MEENNNRLLITAAAIIAALVLVVMAALWIYGRLTTGTITLTATDEGAYAKIAKVDAGEDDPPIAQAKQKVSARVGAGDYRLTVFSHSYSSVKVVSIKARQNLDFKLSLADITLKPEPVYGNSASSLVASADQLMFIDPEGRLARIDGQSRLSILDSAHGLTGIRWAGTPFGVGRDSKGSFYTVSAGALAPLALPFKNGDGTAVSYDVSSNGDLYISDGQNVYLRSAGSFKNIYSSGNNYNSGLFATDGKVAVLENDSNSGSSTLVVVDRDGESTRHRTSFDQAEWSPDGKYLAIWNDDEATILDQDLNNVADIRQANTGPFLWDGSTAVYYAVGSQLWTYRVKGGQTAQAANMPNRNPIAEMALSQDGAYIYTIAGQVDETGRSSSSQILRLGLKNQDFDNGLASLSIFLPEEVGVCSLDFVNFTKLVITIRYPSSGTDPELCIGAAKGELNDYHIDPDRASFITIPYTVNY